MKSWKLLCKNSRRNMADAQSLLLELTFFFFFFHLFALISLEKSLYDSLKTHIIALTLVSFCLSFLTFL